VENINFYILPKTEFRAKTFRYELAERSLSQIYQVSQLNKPSALTVQPLPVGILANWWVLTT
jgi:hypothetical protein